MRRMIIIIFSMLAAIYVQAQSDYIIMRDGQEIVGKIVRVDNSSVVYEASSKLISLKKSEEKSLDLKDVYMLHYESRGNIYITSEGRRITGENQKIDKNADVIYLVSGKEIPAYDVRVSMDDVRFRSHDIAKKKKKNAPNRPNPEQVFSISEVFMIKYKDGTKDILTEFVQPSGQQEVVEEPQEESEVEVQQVVFHNVQRGETLNFIAKRYDVKVEDIIQWNDLPQSIKPNAKLQTDMQLMLYVKPEK